MIEQIGTPAIFGNMANPDKTGFVAEVLQPSPGVYTLSGGLISERARYVIAWEDRTFSEVSDGIAAPWFAMAKRCNVEPVTAERAAEMLADAKTETARKNAEMREGRERERERIAAWQEEHRAKVPSDAKAVIVAELEQDDSDSMTDYFSVSTQRTVILGFSRHTRDLFPEMRKAAARFGETAHLVDAPESAEHREKYSMGSGYYLKAGNKYSSGWAVRKRRIGGARGNNDPIAGLPAGDWMVPDAAPYVTGQTRTEHATEARQGADNLPTETVAGCIITPATHTKKGFKMWIVQIPDRVERDMFDRLLRQAKDSRGWYSRKWGSTPAGFAFKDADAARNFAAEAFANA